MCRKIKLITIIFFVLLLNQEVSSKSSNFSLSSYQKARNIIISAINAHGGFKTFESIKNFILFYKEFDSNRGQNLRSDLPDEFEEGGNARIIYDGATGNIRFERNLQRRGRLFNPVFVFKGNEGFFYWPETNELDTSINIGLIKKLFNFRYTYPPRFIPHLILKNALKNNETLRWIGESKYSGRPHNIISFTDNDGSLFTLYIDKKTNLLTKTEEVIDDLLLGDSIGEIVYKNYFEKEGLIFPKEIVQMVGGIEKQKIITLDLKLNTQLDNSLFELPDGVQPSNYPQIFSLQKLAEGVFFVPLFNATGISYNSMFIVFDDYVLVMDAPLSDLLSKFYIGLINRVAPGKPVKYVVPTHYHWDHSGGIKQFVATGSQIITTPGNENFFRVVVAAQRSLKSNLPDLSDKISINIFTDKKVLKGKTQIVELYNIGPNPHADEIIIAYLPVHKILYVTDLFWGVLTDHDPPARKTLTDFAEKIEALGLDVKIIAPGHGKVSTIEDLKKALKAG